MAVPAARRPMEWRLCSWTRSSSANSHCSRTNKARAHVWFRKAILGCSWLTSSDRDLRTKPGCSHKSYTARSTERCPVEPLSSTCPFCGSRNVVERNPESRSKEELRPRRTRKVDSRAHLQVARAHAKQHMHLARRKLAFVPNDSRHRMSKRHWRACNAPGPSPIMDENMQTKISCLDAPHWTPWRRSVVKSGCQVVVVSRGTNQPNKEATNNKLSCRGFVLRWAWCGGSDGRFHSNSEFPYQNAFGMVLGAKRQYPLSSEPSSEAGVFASSSNSVQPVPKFSCRSHPGFGDCSATRIFVLWPPLVAAPMRDTLPPCRCHTLLPVVTGRRHTQLVCMASSVFDLLSHRRWSRPGNSFDTSGNRT